MEVMRMLPGLFVLIACAVLAGISTSILVRAGFSHVQIGIYVAVIVLAVGVVAAMVATGSAMLF